MAKTLKPRLWWRYMEEGEESQTSFRLGLRPGDQISGKCIDANRLQGVLVLILGTLRVHSLSQEAGFWCITYFTRLLLLLSLWLFLLSWSCSENTPSTEEKRFPSICPLPLPPSLLSFFLLFIYWSALRIAYPSNIDSPAPLTACSPSPPPPFFFSPFPPCLLLLVRQQLPLIGSWSSPFLELCKRPAFALACGSPASSRHALLLVNLLACSNHSREPFSFGLQQ